MLQVFKSFFNKYGCNCDDINVRKNVPAIRDKKHKWADFITWLYQEF